MRRLMLPAVMLVQLPGCAGVATLLAMQHEEEQVRAGDQLLLRAQAAAAAAGQRSAGIEGALQALGAALPLEATALPAFRIQALQVQQALDVDAILLSTPGGEILLDTRTGTDAAPPPGQAQTGPPASLVRITVTHAGAPHVLAAVLTPERLQQVMAGAPLPAGWGSMLVDERGVVLARGPGASRPSEPPLHPALRTAIASKPRGVLELQERDGQSALAAYALSPSSRWVAIVTQPGSQVSAGVWRSAGIAAAVSLAFLLTLSWPFARPARPFAGAKASEQRREVPPPAPEPVVNGGPRRPVNEFPKSLYDEVLARQAETARELHDGVGSGLAGVTMLLGTALSFTREPEAAALIKRSQELVMQATQHIRAISRGIMPAGQERGGLLPALQLFAADMGAVRGVACSVRSRGDFSDVAAVVGGHVFRIVQEATNNALRHGHATRIGITLARAGARCRLVIADNGTGCEAAAICGPQAGLGVRSMRARAEAIAGVLEFKRQARGGLLLRLTWSHGAPPVALA